MINSIRVRNLRAIEDSGVINLRRINVLVGRNSSGKSTILRLLPLLRQSVEERTKGPILWYGRLVDFGDFKNAARDGNTERGISLTFELTLSRRVPARPQVNKEVEGLLLPRKSGLTTEVSLLLGRSSGDKVGHIKNLFLSIGGDDVVVEYDNDGAVKKLVVMGTSVELESHHSWDVRDGKMIPGLYLLVESSYADEDGNIESFLDLEERPFSESVSQCLLDIAHGNTSAERLGTVAHRLSYGSPNEFFEHLLSVPTMPPSLRSRIELLGPDSHEITNLRRSVLLSRLDDLLRAVDDELDRFARGVKYLEPVRATAERYYREQDLAVDEIDSRGTNTAMFLSSLSERDSRALKEWTKSNFGFDIQVETGTGHVQIKIADGSHRSRNIADLGFGYSQVLPILLQLWVGTRANSSGGGSIIAMEQPELHLHPHYQAILADVIGAAYSTAATAFKGNKVFIETHSDHFVNRLGYLVSKGTINPSHVQVIVVSEDDFGDSSARSVEFDNDGTLSTGWPAGFFTPGI